MDTDTRRLALAGLLVALLVAPALRAQDADAIYAVCQLGKTTQLCGFDGPGPPSFVSSASFPTGQTTLVVSSNGQVAAYVTSGQIYTSDLNRSGVTAVGAPTLGISLLALSPDASRIAYIASGGLHVMDAATGVSATVVTGLTFGGTEVLEWSPDGTRVLYSARSPTVQNATPLYTVPADGGAAPTQLTFPEAAVTERSTVRDTRADWSFDGASVAFIRTTTTFPVGAPSTVRYTVYRLPAAGGALQEVYDEDGLGQGALWGVEWAPDGSRLAVHRRQNSPGRFSIYTVPAGGGSLSTIYSVQVGESDYLPQVQIEWARERPLTDIVVNETGDAPNDPESTDAEVCDADPDASGDQCTLRAAIELANALGGARITFNIPGGGVPRIDVPAEEESDQLPAFTAAIAVDGTTQPGGWVELVGPGQSRDDDPIIAGIEVEQAGGGSDIRGLVIHGFRDAGIILRAGADGCVIQGNRIGTDVTGTQWRGNGDTFFVKDPTGTLLPRLATGTGVEVYSSGNVIRGNVLAGNVWTRESSGSGGTTSAGGMDLLFGPSAFDNRVEGNRIGVGADGAVVAVPEIDTILRVEYIGIGATGGGGHVIGGSVTGVPGVCEATCNHVAGHQVEMWLSPWRFNEDTWPGTVGVTVEGNFVGVDAAGAILPPYGAFDQGGIYVGDDTDLTTPSNERAAHNLVGAMGAADGSVTGIFVSGVGGEIVGNRVWGDPGLDIGSGSGFDISYRGIEAGGVGVVVRENVVVGNTRWGIMAGGVGTRVEGNEVSGNRSGGIYAPGRDVTLTGNHVHGNGIGVLADGAAEGVRITANRIYDNRIGIDLAPGAFAGDGVTINDLFDGDAGGNRLQNYPRVFRATLDGGTLSVAGSISTPLSESTAYTVEVYLSAGCRSRALNGGSVYGQGESFFHGLQTASSLGDAPVEVTVGGVPPGATHVSMTATRDASGETSEFGPCVALAGAGQVAQADVGQGETGAVLAGQGVVVTIADAAARRSGAAATRGHDGGTLYVTRYEAAPDTSVFGDATATGPGGTAVRPTAVAARHWRLADRGLTREGGAGSGAEATFSVCVDPASVVRPEAVASVVVVRRAEDTGGVWVPYATTVETHGGEALLCAAGVAALGEFGVGGAETAFPVGAEDGAPSEAPLSLSLRVFPNPIRATATLSLDLPAAGLVTVEVFDALGRRVARVHDGETAAGARAFAVDTGSLAPGVYVARVVAPSGSVSQRLTVVR